jgi:hypothetical protein
VTFLFDNLLCIITCLAWDKYYFKYIWNLKHNRFVIVQLPWMDQVAIVRNLACSQYVYSKH